MKRLLWLLPVLFVTVISAAPTLPQQGSAAISSVLKAATDRGDVPGVAVAVVNKEGVLYNEAFGKSRTLTSTPMAKDTIFNMASMTKPVTSIAIMMLVDEGKLKIDDEVAKYLPKWKDPLVISKFNDADASYETRPAKRPITIRHLLTHTSGIGYGFSSPTLPRSWRRRRRPSSIFRSSSIRARAGPMAPAPASSATSSRRFRDRRSMRSSRRDSAPLGMHDTSYLVPTEKISRVVAVNARGTDGKFVERPMPATLPAQVQGDGGLYGTTTDYGLFLRMLLNRGTLNGKRILSERSVKTIFENHMGSVVVQPQESANQTLSRNFPVGAGKDRWGLGFQLARRNRRIRAARGAARGPASSTRISSSIRARRLASS